MITVKILNDDELVEEFHIMLVGGGLKGLGGPTGYDYVLMKPKHPDMPSIAHKLEEGDLMLVVKTLFTYIKVCSENPNNIVQFPQKKEG